MTEPQHRTALSYPEVASRVFDTPLLISESKLQAILRVLSPRIGFDVPTHFGPEAEAPAPDNKAAHAAALQRVSLTRAEEGHWLAGSIAVIPVIGTLVQRGGYVGYSGMTSYDAIGRMVEAALNNPQVGKILYDFDTPGGEVAGAFDLADMIHEARGEKPMIAVANELTASAGYLLASATGNVVVARTGYTGSIGVVTAHVDYSDALKANGVAVTYVYAGDKKVDGNPYEPLSKRAKADKQRDIDELYAMFVDAVARYRGMSPQAVVDTQAGVFLGRHGVESRLADRVNSFANELHNAQLPANSAALRVQTTNPPSSLKPPQQADEQAPQAATPRLTQQPEEGITMEPEKDTAAQAKAKAATQAPPADHAASAQSERNRIAAILQSDEAKGRTTAAQQLALKTGMSAEEAIGLLATLPKQSAEASPLAAAMGALGPTGVQPDASADVDTGQVTSVAESLDTSAIYGRLNGALSATEH
jgi:signal peptide peptidase SppA